MNSIQLGLDPDSETDFATSPTGTYRLHQRLRLCGGADVRRSESNHVSVNTGKLRQAFCQPIHYIKPSSYNSKKVGLFGPTHFRPFEFTGFAGNRYLAAS